MCAIVDETGYESQLQQDDATSQSLGPTNCDEDHSFTTSTSESARACEVGSSIHLEPHQPQKLAFPKVYFGKQQRSFKASWFAKWKWLEWDDVKQCAFCHPCRMTSILGFLTFSLKAEDAFSSRGFKNWKNATDLFHKHEVSHAHREAVMKWIHHVKSQPIAAQLAKQLKDEQLKSQACLLRIVSSLHFLARQGIPIRGHEDTEGNFMQLLQLRSSDFDDLNLWLAQNTHWTSHDMQNEIIQIMSHKVITRILDSVKQNRYFSILVDESVDVSFKEQVGICLRHVSSDLSVYEEFLGLYETSNTTAETLTVIIKDAMCRFGLDLQNCRGQGYDGASNMSGHISGVQARISGEYPKAMYIHCFCHSLNLAVQDTSIKLSVVRDALSTIQELSHLIKYSGKRKALLEKIRIDLSCDDGPSLRPLCNTRWTVKAKSFLSVLNNYEALMQTMAEIVQDKNSNFEVTSKAGGIQKKNGII